MWISTKIQFGQFVWRWVNYKFSKYISTLSLETCVCQSEGFQNHNPFIISLARVWTLASQYLKCDPIVSQKCRPKCHIAHWHDITSTRIIPSFEHYTVPLRLLCWKYVRYKVQAQDKVTQKMMSLLQSLIISTLSYYMKLPNIMDFEWDLWSVTYIEHLYGRSGYFAELRASSIFRSSG